MDNKEKAVSRASKIMYELPFNELDKYLEEVFSIQYFGNESLYKYFINNQFDCHCSMGSLVCSINLPLKATLVRADLVTSKKGKRFFHAFIETEYKGQDYVIDTSLARAVPKELYYKLLEPRVFRKVNRDDLFVNNFVLFLKDLLTKPNNLNIQFIYDAWSQYEAKNLRNISNNSLLNEHMLTNPKVIKLK